jgi:hypothetical protein
MIKLPKITLICLTNKDFEGHKKALEKSCEGIEWGGVKLIWDEKIRDINDWNKKIIYELWRYVDTEYALLIHADGYVIHPELWKDEWLNYDYIGAPWPLPKDNYSYKDEKGNFQRVGNSISLRSKKILTLPTLLGFEWKPYYGNTNEDGFLCCHHRNELEESGMKFAPLEVAKYFSKEHEIPENIGLSTFAFHQV